MTTDRDPAACRDAPSGGRGDRSLAFHPGWRAGLLLATVSMLLIRMGYVLGALLVKCPAERARIVLFASVAVILLAAPGLFIRRWLRLTFTNLFSDLTFVLVSSLCGSALLAWTMYALGIYTRPVLIGGLTVLLFGGLYGAGDLFLPASRFPARLKRMAALSAVEWVVLIIGLWFALGLFERVLGTPMVSWDALTSWDKWAADAGMRRFLGQYAMGGYPQFLPSLGSIFYKLSGSGGEVFSVEHLLLHGFYVSFVAILILASLALGRELQMPGGIILCLFAGSKLVMEQVTGLIGSVDIPFVAMLFSASALCTAYANGAWRSGRGGWRDSVALFFPFMAVLFMKGNGMAWSGLFFGAMWFNLRKWEKIKPALAAFSAAWVVSLPYLLHQIWYGAMHWGLSEQSPFLRSHTFVAAHTEQFKMSWAHLKDWIERMGGSYGITAQYGGVVLLVVLLMLCLWAAGKRNLRFFAITGPLALVVWFFTGSYDFRNAAGPWAMSMVAIAGVLWAGGEGKRSRTVRWVLRCALVAAALWCLNNIRVMSRLPLPVGKQDVYLDRGGAAPSVFSLPWRKYRVPKIAAMPRDQRHMGVRPWGDIREILFNAPYGMRATHLLAADGLYRVLAPKGVYMMHKNRYNDQRRYDVALGEPYLKPPPQYEKVAQFRRVGMYNVAVRIFMPEFHDVAMRVAGPRAVDIRDVWIKAGETASIEFDGSLEEAGKLKEGILSLSVFPPDATVSLSLGADDAPRDPYSGYFKSIRKDACVRLLYWMNDDTPALPRFTLQAGNKDLRIVSAEWGQ